VFGTPPSEPGPATRAPAPRPEPVVAPREPPPAPAETHFRLCALAPGTPAGLRELDAVRVAGRPDTLAEVAGQRMPLGQAVGSVRVADQMAWFRAHQALDIRFGPRVQSYRIYDVGRIIPAGQLAYLGTIDDLPVYAAASDVAPVQPVLTRLLAGEQSLPRLLAADPALVVHLRAVDVLYVPLHATGCIFQPLLKEGAQ
jgi:hypothetical protein